jgi:hypothetical protein
VGGGKSQDLVVNTSVHHWRFDDGKTVPNPGSQWELDSPPQGWYCWVYPKDNFEFKSWMEKNCPTADCTPRFNSGDPMFTVYISDEKEATIFQLKWL